MNSHIISGRALIAITAIAAAAQHAGPAAHGPARAGPPAASTALPCGFATQTRYKDPVAHPAPTGHGNRS